LPRSANLETVERFADYSLRLIKSAENDPSVLGLVLLGSTAETHRVDEWSDHDFFWVVKNGVGEKYRQDLSWIPDIENAILHPRETAHGLKIVFVDGHVLEFAVFEEQELPLAGVNSFAVPVDKTNILEVITRLAATSREDRPFNWDDEFELFLTLILIGVGRYRRGEILIAGQFIRSHCLNHLLGMIRVIQAPKAEFLRVEDSFNRFRRFDFQYPELAMRIEQALHQNVEECAALLLTLAIELKALTHRSERQIFAIKNRLGWIV
jgi:hypothetical protein